MADAAPSAHASTSAPVPAKEFPIPPPTAIKALAPEPSITPPQSTPSARVIVPPRGTLAAGKWEAKPATIWIAVALGALVLLLWALFRVRRVVNERKRKLEALTSVRKASSSPS
jgi:hypothetical protein